MLWICSAYRATQEPKSTETKTHQIVGLCLPRLKTSRNEHGTARDDIETARFSNPRHRKPITKTLKEAAVFLFLLETKMHTTRTHGTSSLLVGRIANLALLALLVCWLPLMARMTVFLTARSVEHTLVAASFIQDFTHTTTAGTCLPSQSACTDEMSWVGVSAMCARVFQRQRRRAVFYGCVRALPCE